MYSIFYFWSLESRFCAIHPIDELHGVDCPDGIGHRPGLVVDHAVEVKVWAECCHARRLLSWPVWPQWKPSAISQS
jgi:hypothetical protein